MTKKVVKKKSVKTVSEKVLILLHEIHDMQQITSHGTQIKIPYARMREIGLDGDFVNSFLTHLNQEGVVKLIRLGRPFMGFSMFGEEITVPNDYHYVFKLTETFDQFYKKKICELVKNDTASKVINSNEFTLKISYSENTREIILNDLFVIAKLDFESENDRVFYYLHNNPNRTIELAEIEEHANSKKTLTKPLTKIVENLKFKKELRAAFFEVSKTSIKFLNPISKKRLQELGISKIQIKLD